MACLLHIIFSKAKSIKFRDDESVQITSKYLSCVATMVSEYEFKINEINLLGEIIVIKKLQLITLKRLLQQKYKQLCLNKSNYSCQMSLS